MVIAELIVKSIAIIADDANIADLFKPSCGAELPIITANFCPCCGTKL